MAKKVKSKPTRRDNALILTIVILGSFLLLIFVVVFLQDKSQTSACANSISCIKDLSGKKEASSEGVFMEKKVTAPELPASPEFAINTMQAVLGDATGDYKHIYVNLATQHLYAYEGSNLVYDFPVSTGKWHPTPTGNFRIWIWLRYTRMTGGDASKGTYYNLPNVPFTMYFYNAATPKSDGYSLHGAYWHNNFGHPMSHGCVNLAIPTAQKIYYWTNPLAGNVAYANTSNPGTLITIYGTPPANETSFID